MASIGKYNSAIPRLTTQQMIEVDRLMIEEYRIELIQMMENAGRCLAILAADRFLDHQLAGKQVLVLAGTGGNGGGSMVCARRLHNWGAQVKVYLTNEDSHMTPVPRHQLEILRRMGIEIHLGDALDQASYIDLIIDGIIGYSVKGDPYGLPGAMIEWTQRVAAPVLSLDTPSGLDLTSGTVHHPTVNATATLTLALPKNGLFEPQAMPLVGDLYLGDISVPPELYAEPSLGIRVPKDLFTQSDVLKIG
jgi:NAD(P)H-hydrate epimerase